MSSESELVINLWDVIRENVPNSKKSDMAVEVIRLFADFGFESDDLEDIVDEDVHLTEAYKLIYENDDDEEYDDEEGLED